MSTSRIPGEFVLILEGFRKYISCIPQCYSLLWLLCFVVGLLVCLVGWDFGSYTDQWALTQSEHAWYVPGPALNITVSVSQLGKTDVTHFRIKGQSSVALDVLSPCTWIFHRLFMHSINIYQMYVLFQEEVWKYQKSAKGLYPLSLAS